MSDRFADPMTVQIHREGDWLDLGSRCSSLRYNAAISAFELRAPRLADPEASAFPDDLKDGGALVVQFMGLAAFRIRFAVATLIPVEVEARRRSGEFDAVCELAVLRECRVEPFRKAAP